MDGHTSADEEPTTTRLSLRHPTADHVDAVLAIHSDPAACAHNPSDALTERTEAERLHQRWDDQWRRHGYGYWVVRWRGAARTPGFCGVKPMDPAGLRALNLFYRFAPATWGRGLAGGAATAVVTWAGRRMPRLPVAARIRPANTASQRVAPRAGPVRAAHLDCPGEDGLDWIFATNLPGSGGGSR